MKKYILISIGILLTVTCFSQNTYTNGEGDQNWNNFKNWSLNVVPSFGDSVIVPQNETVRIKTGAVGTVKCINLEGTLEVLGSLTVDGGYKGIFDESNNSTLTGSMLVQGTVSVSNVKDGSGIQLTGTLDIDVGEVLISQVSDHGISVGGGYNHGYIEVVEASSYGIITKSGIFTNYESIKLTNCYGGIWTAVGDFTNDGVLDFNNIDFPFFIIGGDFINDESIIITHSLPTNFTLFNIMNSNFTNNGFFKIANSNGLCNFVAHTEMLNSSTGLMYFENVDISGTAFDAMVNYGVVESRGSILGSINNYGFVASDKYSTSVNNQSGSCYYFEEDDEFYGNQPTSNFMIGNDMLNWTDELFLDSLLTQSAGPLLNGGVFVPNSNAIGHKNFFCSINYGVNSNWTIRVDLKYRIRESDNIYIGGVNGAWENPNNWSKSHSPTAGEFVQINNSTDSVTIHADTNILGFYSEGKVKIMDDVEVVIDGFKDTSIDLFLSSARLINDGNITVSNCGGNPAINVLASSELTNNGSFNIDKVRDGIIHTGTGAPLTNNGIMSMTNISFRGIQAWDFINTGELNMHSLSFTPLDIPYTFYNSGLIEIDGSDLLNTANQHGMKVGHEVTNTATGTILINNVRNSFIHFGYIPPNGKSDINNYGDIICSGSMDIGIYATDATLTNHATGRIILSQVDRDNIVLMGALAANRTFDIYNHGLIQTFDSGLLYKDGDFSQNHMGLLVGGDSQLINESCGRLEVDDYLKIDSDGTLVNKGTIVSSEDYFAVFSSRVTNDGVILDKSDFWPTAVLVQNEYLFKGLVDPVIVGTPISVFEVGNVGSVSFASSFYNDKNLTINAGAYDNNTNMWTPIANLTNATEAFIEVEYATCKDTIRINWDDPAVNPCSSHTFTTNGQGGYQGDWNSAGSWSQGVVPMGCDTAIIDGNLFEVYIGSAGATASVIKLIDSKLTAASNAVITLIGYHTPLTLIGSAYLDNDGVINITSQEEGILFDGNFGSIDNFGTINIESAKDGILINGEGEVVNKVGGTFNISSSSNSHTAIKSVAEESYFNNYGNILLENYFHAIAFEELGFFTNHPSALIDIQIIYGSAIRMSNESELNNRGDISIAESPIGLEIKLDGYVFNGTGASLTISDVDHPFSMDGTVQIFNTGMIVIE